MKRLKAVEKKKEAIRLAPKQDRQIELLARWFQDHKDKWRTFVGVDRAKRLGIDLDAKPSRQSLWLVGLELVASDIRTFRASGLVRGPVIARKL